MENLILVPFTRSEFKQLIKDAVKEILSESSTSKNISPYDYISLKEACEFLKLAKPTIYTLTSKRLIPYIKKGKKLYFKKSELEKWLNDGAKRTIQEIESDETLLH